MLVEHFAGGRDLDYFLKKAAYEGKNEPVSVISVSDAKGKIEL
jgi:hypothetical protein